MTFLNRRRFLQFAGSTLASIGLSQWDWLNRGNHMARVLAQPTPRKLALLVGINAYAPGFNWNPLAGCVNDVRMQEELLVYRFGFNRHDILSLTDEAATRDNILTAFQDHLIKQARPGDVVVFHYSGHGSRVVDPNPYQAEDPLNSTLVPIDSPLPANFQETGGEVNDIMGRTLFLLMSALPTELVTVVLDSCHSGGGKRGTLTVRSRDGATRPDDRLYPSRQELDYQDKQRSQLNWSEADVYQRRQAGVAKGVVIASAAANQLASDAQFDGFEAGAFTYLMTQYLWQISGDESVNSTMATLARITRNQARSLSGILQEPEFEANVPAELQTAPIYFIPKQTAPAEGVIIATEGDRLTLWLGGVNAQGLAALEQAVFAALDGNGEELSQIQLISRDGLAASAQMLGTSRAVLDQGTAVQEKIRGIPDNLALRIALDPSLGDELSVAQQVLSSLPRLDVRSLEDGEIDYILGRVTDLYASQHADTVDLPTVGSIGLFLPGQAVLPGSFANAGESVTDAIQRLRSKFSVLLASRLLRILINPGSSQLNIAATMQPVGTSASATATPLTVRGQRSLTTEQSVIPSPDLTNIPVDASRLPLGTTVELTLHNNDVWDLYASILSIGPDGEIISVFPSTFDAPDAAALVPRGATLRVPDTARGDRFLLHLVPPVGIVEVLFIASTVPLRNTLRALGHLATSMGTSRGQPIVANAEILDVTETLLNDLDQGTRSSTRNYSSNDARGVSSNQLAAFSIMFELYDPAQE